MYIKDGYLCKDERIVIGRDNISDLHKDITTRYKVNSEGLFEEVKEV